MNNCSLIASAGWLVASFIFSTSAKAQTPDVNVSAPTPIVFSADFDVRHKECLELIGQDAELAFEEAMIWRGDGGGRRARHCEAMALFALGHPAEAANRLKVLAESKIGGTPAMKADFFAESADLWLAAGESQEAFDAANAGLEIQENHVPSRMARARAYAKMGRWDYAEVDLSNVLVFDQTSVEAWRLRADVRRRQGDLVKAKSDIDYAIILDDKSIENYVVRGEILEAQRAAASPESSASPTP